MEAISSDCPTIFKEDVMLVSLLGCNVDTYSWIKWGALLLFSEVRAEREPAINTCGLCSVIIRGNRTRLFL